MRIQIDILYIVYIQKICQLRFNTGSTTVFHYSSKIAPSYETKKKHILKTTPKTKIELRSKQINCIFKQSVKKIDLKTMSDVQKAQELIAELQKFMNTKHIAMEKEILHILSEEDTEKDTEKILMDHPDLNVKLGQIQQNDVQLRNVIGSLFEEKMRSIQQLQDEIKELKELKQQIHDKLKINSSSGPAIAANFRGIGRNYNKKTKDLASSGGDAPNKTQTPKWSWKQCKKYEKSYDNVKKKTLKMWKISKYQL